MKIECPACGAELCARTTDFQSVTLRRIYSVCRKCGFKARAELEILHSLSPSSRPRAEVLLEVRPAPMLRGTVNARTSAARVGAQ
ncbi:ogr/Delta-like zinc finger family protein [Paraburkholderia nemoris]|uniref:ogr/Delta-like zinc finger family protein n=1 Tax=Paraburkholderia nemoris TaxID=2793076 RepID=UPI001F2B10EF|nr:ogr/Delta-like zinc finger family protein [Paraburkholderia nemoris]